MEIPMRSTRSTLSPDVGGSLGLESWVAGPEDHFQGQPAAM